MNVARLNEHGIGIFAAWIETLKQGGSVQAPSSVLTDAQFTEPLGVEVRVEARTFENRYEAAEYLHSLFVAAILADIERDRGLWAWLSLFYFDAVCPPGKGGLRKPGALARHVPEPGNYQRYYRHLLAGPYRIYRAHRERPERALALLCQPLDSPGDVVEQLASRQEVVTNPGILELATKLYVDQATHRLKRGAGGKSSGSARRLYDVLEQFDLTWDLYASTGKELATVMPNEFARFLT
ncbi:MAG: hypothetical protein HYY23_15290 [Verrucomicrobia bacterium]|nr:hypothetical protein [Verrucomicrobiota bacterium]